MRAPGPCGGTAPWSADESLLLGQGVARPAGQAQRLCLQRKGDGLGMPRGRFREPRS